MSEVITLADGIEQVADKFAARFRIPYQDYERAWNIWQSAVQGLGAPTAFNSQHYWLPPFEADIETEINEEWVDTKPAIVAVRGTFAHTRKAHRAIRILQRCREDNVPLLPTAELLLWRTIKDETSGYRVRGKPLDPDFPAKIWEAPRLDFPNHREWAKGVDEIGPDILPAYTAIAEDRTDDLQQLASLLGVPVPPAGPGYMVMGLMAVGGTEAGIQL